MPNTKKKTTKKKIEKKAWFDDLSPQAKQAIGAVAVAVLGIFFLTALLDTAGRMGDYVSDGLIYLFGLGAWLAPIVCIGYVVTLLRPKDDESISLSKVFGIALLFLSALGLLEISGKDKGGLIGFSILFPMLYLVGELFSGILLVSITVIALVLIFNTGLQLPQWFKIRKEDVDTKEKISFEPDLASTPVEETGGKEMLIEEESEPEEKETPVKKAGATASALRDKILGKSEVEFRVNNFSGPYDPPPISLLSKDKGKIKTGDTKANANAIKRTLQEFGISVEMDAVEVGPTVTRYALKPAQGVKISRIVGLQRELELNLAAGTIRIEAPIPGKSLVGIEVPNSGRTTIGLSTLLTSPEYTDSPKPLLVALGKDITGHAHFANVARMPHTLIAGTTGSGKSALIHDLVISLLYRNSPEQLRFIMVDPKRVELTLYDGIPHLLNNVITDAKKVLVSLKWAVKEMERRYDVLQLQKLQNIDAYHEKIYKPARDAWVKAGSIEEEREELPEALPYIVIIVDELADLMHSYPRELEALIVRLAQMSRAVGIHLILATQRPSVNVITGTVKANIPTRMALQVASQIDSRTILDQVGAEKLIGQGDMLYLSGELGKPIRLQSAFISNDELQRVVEYLKDQDSAYSLDTVSFDEDTENDPTAFFSSSIGEDDDQDELYNEAKQIVVEAKKASTSFLQRRLRIGYARAARLMDALEDNSVIGPADGAKPRAILIGNDELSHHENIDNGVDDTDSVEETTTYNRQ